MSIEQVLEVVAAVIRFGLSILSPAQVQGLVDREVARKANELAEQLEKDLPG